MNLEQQFNISRNKHNISILNYVVALLAIILFLTQLAFTLTYRSIDNRIDAIETKIQAYQDTIEVMRLHYKDCAFINKEQLEIGYDGYIRVSEGHEFFCKNN